MPEYSNHVVFSLRRFFSRGGIMNIYARIGVAVFLGLMALCIYLWDRMPSASQSLNNPTQRETNSGSSAKDAFNEALDESQFTVIDPEGLEIASPPPEDQRNSETGCPTQESDRLETEPPLPPNEEKPLPSPPPTPETPRTYTVKAGDTLWKIAKKIYGDPTKWKHLFDANKALLKGDQHTLQVNMTLNIPNVDSDKPPDAEKKILEKNTKDKEYIVRSGDTLTSIAEKFYGNRNLWEGIYQANRHRLGWRKACDLKAGQIITIPEQPLLENRRSQD